MTQTPYTLKTKIIAIVILITFGVTSLKFPAYAQGGSDMPWMPKPGTMVSVSPSFEPALIKGLTVHPDNPFLFDFIVDPGQSKLPKEVLKEESDRMVKYFFAALTIPDKDIWVNLSPYEKDRMVPASLGVTAMGRDLLAQDYMLKQLTASLIYPQKDLGKTFWTKVYAKAKEIYGSAQIPVNTFNKVWIVPQKVGIYEHGQTAFIVDGHLKVMLEEDYLASTKHNAIAKTPSADETKQSQVNQLGSQILRQIVLPEIEKEVNEGKNFATLRQIFYSQALAVWFKHNLKQALLSRAYANKGTVKGIDQNNLVTNEAIYQQYLKAYKKGVFNYIKEDIDPVTQENLPRKYFSGGWDGAMMVKAIQLVELSPRAVADVAAEASRYETITVLANTSESNARALAQNVDAELKVGGIDLRGIKITTSGLEAAAFLKVLGLSVSASNDPHVIIVAGQSIDLSNPETFGQAFYRELQEVGTLDEKDMAPEDKMMLGDLSTWFNAVLGVHFAGIATLSAAIVKSTHEFYKAKNATTMEVKREYYKRFRKDWMHIAGAVTIVVTGIVLGAMNGMNIDSIKLDLLAILTGSKIGGGIFGFEKMADELVAAANATDDINDPRLKALENFEGNSPREFFFKYTDWPVMIALFAIAYTKFPDSWNPTILHNVIDFVSKVPHLEWILPVVPVLMGVGIGATLATQVDKNTLVTRESVTQDTINQFFRDHKTERQVVRITTNGEGSVFSSDGHKYILDIDAKPSAELIALSLQEAIGFPSEVKQDLENRLRAAYKEHNIETADVAMMTKAEYNTMARDIETAYSNLLKTIGDGEFSEVRFTGNGENRQLQYFTPGRSTPYLTVAYGSKDNYVVTEINKPSFENVAAEIKKKMKQANATGKKHTITVIAEPRRYLTILIQEGDANKKTLTAVNVPAKASYDTIVEDIETAYSDLLKAIGDGELSEVRFTGNGENRQLQYFTPGRSTPYLTVAYESKDNYVVTEINKPSFENVAAEIKKKMKQANATGKKHTIAVVAEPGRYLTILIKEGELSKRAPRAVDVPREANDTIARDIEITYMKLMSDVAAGKFSQVRLTGEGKSRQLQYYGPGGSLGRSTPYLTVAYGDRDNYTVTEINNPKFEEVAEQIRRKMREANATGKKYTFTVLAEPGKYLTILIQPDSAMGIDGDKAAVAQKPWVQGGIDLSEQDSALRVTKDANGGVKVNVDQALIARIEREGIPEVHPVIINMQPLQSLFGIKVLTNAP